MAEEGARTSGGGRIAQRAGDMAMTECPTGKRTYANQLAANRALLSCWRNGRDERETYQCPECGHYHLTSAGARRDAKPEGMANLRKIAAAPELLSALETFRAEPVPQSPRRPEPRPKRSRGKKHD